MHADLRTVLLILAMVCFALGAMGVSTFKIDTNRLVAAGLAFATLGLLAG